MRTSRLSPLRRFQLQGFVVVIAVILFCFVFYFYHLLVFICLSNEEMVSVRLRPVTKFGANKTVKLEFDGRLGNSYVFQSHP